MGIAYSYFERFSMLAVALTSYYIGRLLFRAYYKHYNETDLTWEEFAHQNGFKIKKKDKNKENLDMQIYWEQQKAQE